ncbi:cystathionine beta-lyase [Oikeobacillus pervagus]|uniref:cysteine-S-conjugate beta-lyase n=1 Tax=Oikeobacillus pervagus TaxID=1325931 RepID=A0AAJ1T0V2_9BACI|nr:MalY/PatB family protein [Oikeobacillus pervagus]MDQ0216503.1 cystathionine beta-lyase [Oikeobacillus pervagus]
MNHFDQIINRKGSSSVKWDGVQKVFGVEDALPMWVADMDFAAAPEIIQALKEVVDHGVYGYTTIPASTTEAICGWMEKRHGWKIDSSWLLFNSGVVPSLALAVEILTEKGDAVLLQSPVYAPFFSMIKNNGRKIANCPLTIGDDQFEINFDQLEKTIQTENVKLFFLCNPHNPGGRVWSEQELIQIAEICKRNEVIIVSDEIHSDLIAPPHKHIPIASLKKDYEEFVITLIAPTKTFNLAGLQASSIIVPNKTIRTKLSNGQLRQGFFTLNMMGITAMEVAYKYGESWLDECIHYIRGNVEYVKDFLQREFPSIQMFDPQGGYLIWINCRELGYSDQELNERLLQKGKLALEPGTKYGKGGEGFVRMNVACPRSTVEEGMKRFKLALQ